MSGYFRFLCAVVLLSLIAVAFKAWFGGSPPSDEAILIIALAMTLLTHRKENV